MTEEKIFAIADALDLEYEVVLAPVLQSYEVYQTYLPVSSYYQQERDKRANRECKLCV